MGEGYREAGTNGRGLWQVGRGSVRLGLKGEDIAGWERADEAGTNGGGRGGG